jgi:hypothetical protein
MSETIVIVSVDTEEDNWSAARDGVTVENIRELPRLQAHGDRLGIPLTYFTTYQVATTPWAAGVLRDLRATGRAEVAAHLHPWNTPPLDEPFVPRHTMMKNLPESLQGAKLATLTRALEEAFGFRPTAFRAGRYGLGCETARVLIEQGYRVDSSVTPWVSWEEMDDGANFVGAPLPAYALDGTTDPRDPVPGGPLLEIPLSSGYTHRPFRAFHAVRMALRAGGLKRLRLDEFAERARIVRPVLLSPEIGSRRDRVKLARALVAEGVPHLSVTLHSTSLKPGLTPWIRSASDVEGVYVALAEFASALSAFTSPTFTTISGAAGWYAARPAFAHLHLPCG